VGLFFVSRSNSVNPFIIFVMCLYFVN